MSKLIHYSSPNGSYILPSGYTRLAWIEGNGSSYIDTGWKYTSGDMTVDIEYTMPTNNNVTVIGSSNDNTKWATLIHHSNGVRLYYCGTQPAAYTKAITAGTKINIVYGISGSNVFVKDERYNTVNKTGWSANCGTIPSQSYTYTLFCHHYGNTYTQIAACKMYHCNIWDKGVLVRQYVPVKTTVAVTNAYGASSSAGTVGMLDLMNNSFYPSKSSTAFISGPECPQGFPTSEYCQVEWIGFDKGKNVNTGVNMDANQQLVMKMGIRYGSVGVGKRDLFGYSNTAEGYMGVTTGNAWEIHGSLSKTSDDIYRYNDITWTNSDPYTGDIWLGSLGSSGYSTRDKYISYVNITVAGVHKIHWVACYRRSDMMPGFYDLVSRTFKEMPDFPIGPSITFGYGMVMNSAPNSSVSYYAIPYNISSGEGRMGEKNGSFTGRGSGYLEFDSLPASSVKTVAFWVKSDKSNQCFYADPTAKTACGFWNNYMIISCNSNNLYTFPITAFITNAWNHIVITYGSTPEVWINGVKQIANTGRNYWTWSGTNKAYLFTKYNNGFGQFSLEYIQDFQIWDEVISNPTSLM